MSGQSWTPWWKEADPLTPAIYNGMTRVELQILVDDFDGKIRRVEDDLGRTLPNDFNGRQRRRLEAKRDALIEEQRPYWQMLHPALIGSIHDAPTQEQFVGPCEGCGVEIDLRHARWLSGGRDFCTKCLSRATDPNRGFPDER
jgi:hypothetical protein